MYICFFAILSQKMVVGRGLFVLLLAVVTLSALPRATTAANFATTITQTPCSGKFDATAGLSNAKSCLYRSDFSKTSFQAGEPNVIADWNLAINTIIRGTAPSINGDNGFPLFASACEYQACMFMNDTECL